MQKQACPVTTVGPPFNNDTVDRTINICFLTIQTVQRKCTVLSMGSLCLRVLFMKEFDSSRQRLYKHWLKTTKAFSVPLSL